LKALSATDVEEILASSLREKNGWQWSASFAAIAKQHSTLTLALAGV
jgi:hypothetical protein